MSENANNNQGFSLKAPVDEKYVVNGYYPTIGIECHVQLKTKTKLFAAVSNEAREAKPNTLVSHICFGLPGALPVLNAEAVRLSSIAAYALGTTPQKYSKFDRKHYFYPDLPKGYQISQFDEPIILGGSLEILIDGKKQTIDITRAHIEEDAGKSTHPAGENYSLVDLNRAGTPLLEIVSEPEMHNSAEAKAYAKELWLRMKYSGVSDVDLYHGNMRFDVNVSLSKDPAELGTRTETKNLNSFKSIERAIEYEIKRQMKVLESGKEIDQETRGWLDDEQKTVSQRSKENSHDYRYFPDPDIPPVRLTDEYIAQIEKQLPIMPSQWREKLLGAGIGNDSVETLLEIGAEFDPGFMSLLIDSPEKDAKAYANWVINIEAPLRRELAAKSEDLVIDYDIRSKVFKGVYALSSGGKVSSNNAKSLIIEFLSTNTVLDDIEEHANKAGYIQMSDTGAIESIVIKVIEDNPKPVAEIKDGNMKVIGFLVGQVMKASQGKANPAMARELIIKQLG